MLQEHALVVYAGQVQDEITCATKVYCITSPGACLNVRASQCCMSLQAPGRWRPIRMVLGMYTRRHQSRILLRQT